MVKYDASTCTNMLRLCKHIDVCKYDCNCLQPSRERSRCDDATACSQITANSTVCIFFIFTFFVDESLHKR